MSEYQQTNNELAHTLGRIEATLEKFEETLTRFDHKIFGNGQPGEFQIHDRRIQKLEDYKTFIKGALATLTGIVSLLGGTMIYRIFFRE